MARRTQRRLGDGSIFYDKKRRRWVAMASLPRGVDGRRPSDTVAFGARLGVASVAVKARSGREVDEDVGDLLLLEVFFNEISSYV